MEVNSSIGDDSMTVEEYLQYLKEKGDEESSTYKEVKQAWEEGRNLHIRVNADGTMDCIEETGKETPVQIVWSTGKKQDIKITFMNHPSEKALKDYVNTLIDLYDEFGYKYMNEEAKGDKES